MCCLATKAHILYMYSTSGQDDHKVAKFLRLATDYKKDCKMVVRPPATLGMGPKQGT